MLKTGTLVNRCYILRQPLQEDAFCEWWRASAIFAASDFLLRIVKPEYAAPDVESDYFSRDAWQSYDVASPSVLPLIEIDRIEGRPFVVSEYSGFTTLRSQLEAGFSAPLEHACRFVIELAEGIDSFHQKKIIYGTLAPDSVVLVRSGERVEEFKIERPSYDKLYAMIPDDRLDDLRNSWGYAAPEFKTGSPCCPASDIYSLGILLYRLIADRIPYGSRSALRVKERSASPGHVAASLARRGIPKEIALIIVRALRKNPAARYGEAVPFIADLRAFLDSRREASLRSGGEDPIADLATLNLKKAKAGAREITRSLETVDYFRILSEAAVSPKEKAEMMDLIYAFRMTPEVEELEELEAEGDEDDDSRDAESYIEEGYGMHARAAGRREEPPKEKEQEPPAAEAEEAPESIAVSEENGPGPEPLPGPPQPPAPAPSVPLPEKKAEPRRTPARRTEAPETALPAPAAAAPRKEERKGVHWRRSGGTPVEIAEELAVSIKRAARGRGSFRFIEDPGEGEAAKLIGEAIGSFREKALIVDLGVLPAGEDFERAGRSIAEALDLAAQKESGNGRKGLGRKLAGLGEWNGSAAQLVLRIGLAAKKERPLVIVGRGAESVGRSFQPFIAELAAFARNSALCVFFFYWNVPSESWHVLSALGKDRSVTGESRS